MDDPQQVLTAQFQPYNFELDMMKVLTPPSLPPPLTKQIHPCV